MAARTKWIKLGEAQEVYAELTKAKPARGPKVTACVWMDYAKPGNKRKLHLGRFDMSEANRWTQGWIRPAMFKPVVPGLYMTTPSVALEALACLR